MKKLFNYLRPFKGQLSFSMTSSVVNKILDLMPPLLVAWVIDTVGGKAPKWIVSLTGAEDPMTLAATLSILAFLIFGFESVFQWMYQFGFQTLAQKVQHHLRMDAYAHLQSKEISYFENNRLGETLSILNDDVNQLERFMNNGFNEILQLFVTVAFSCTVLFAASWQLALISLVTIPLIVIGSFYFQKLIAPRYTKMRASVGHLNSRLENNISGITVIKSFTAETYELERVKEASQRYHDTNVSAIKLNTLYVPIIRMVISLGFSGVLLLGSYWVLEGYDFISIGELVLFSMLIQRLLWPLTTLGTTVDTYERSNASAKRIFNFLESPSIIQDPSDPEALSRENCGIEFEDVHFHYGNNIQILNGFNLTIKHGETIGIAGTTGSGKSTFIKLLLRLYDIDRGAITIGGVDIRDVRLNDLRHHISLVSQDTYLFHGTIYENIAYGNETATLQDVIAAAKHAEFDDFVQTLPDKYESMVGERGIKLSGGQKQRLSIARAILKNAPVMIFDEATSSVDTETEKCIKKNLDKITKGKTAIIIAHRLSTIRNADRIVVINDGQVVEQGKHDALIKAKGTYAELWGIQVGEV
jgi:ATP-binding cassette subfamily B protein